MLWPRLGQRIVYFPLKLFSRLGEGKGVSVVYLFAAPDGDLFELADVVYEDVHEHLVRGEGEREGRELGGEGVSVVYLFAAPDGDLFECADVVYEDVHEAQFVTEAHEHVQS